MPFPEISILREEIRELIIHDVPAVASLPALQNVIDGRISIEDATSFFANGITQASDLEIILRFFQESAGFLGRNSIITPAVRAHAQLLHLMFTQNHYFNSFPRRASQLQKISPETVIDIFNGASEAAYLAIKDPKVCRISVGAAYKVWKSVNPWHLQFVCWGYDEIRQARRLPIDQVSPNLYGLMHDNKLGKEVAELFSLHMQDDLKSAIALVGFDPNKWTINSSGTTTYYSDYSLNDVLKNAHDFWPKIEEYAPLIWDQNTSYHVPHSQEAFVNEQERRGTSIVLVSENGKTQLHVMFGRKMGGRVEGGFDEGGDGKTVGGPVECGGHGLIRTTLKGADYLRYCLTFHENCFNLLERIPNCTINNDNYTILKNLRGYVANLGQ